MSKYRWHIAWELGSKVDIHGPGDLDASVTDNPQSFVLRDDDGEVYCKGTLYGNWYGFEPLDDYGTPSLGATEIWMNGERV
mgnify:CR=1 FL=1